MKIHIAGAYTLADGYLGAADALGRLGHKISFSPMMMYSHDNRSTHVNKIIADIQTASPDVILWWGAETLSPNELAAIRKNVSGIFALYTWNQMVFWENKEVEMKNKCKSLDIAFTCCKTSMSMYEQYRCRAIYAPLGFDPKVHYPESDAEYECDVSMVLTNLYHGNEMSRKPHISRKELLETIVTRIPDVNLKIYGPPSIGAHFSQHYYAGEASFKDTHKIFHNSKINLCTHIRPDAEMYYNERVAQVLGSKGFLLVDHVIGLEQILELGKDCMIVDFSSPKKFVRQIRSLLASYESIAPDIKSHGYEKAKNKMTWLHWAEIVDCSLKE